MRLAILPIGSLVIIFLVVIVVIFEVHAEHSFSARCQQMYDGHTITTGYHDTGQICIDPDGRIVDSR